MVRSSSSSAQVSLQSRSAQMCCPYVWRLQVVICDRARARVLVCCVWRRVLRTRYRDGADEFGISEKDRRAVIFVWRPLSKCLGDSVLVGYELAYCAGCQWILETDAGFSHTLERLQSS